MILIAVTDFWHLDDLRSCNLEWVIMAALMVRYYWDIVFAGKQMQSHYQKPGRLKSSRR